MALRIILVGLALGFGCEPPSRTDVVTMIEQGRNWIDRHLSAEVASHAGAKPDAAAELARLDEAMASAMTRTVAEFRAAMTTPATKPGEPTAVLAAMESPEPSDEAARVEEPAAVPIEGDVVEADRPSPPSPDRVTSAVELTRQAASAWMNLLDPGKADETR